MNLGRYNEAVADFDLAIEIKPEHGRAYQKRSFSYYKLGQLDKAQAYCDKARALITYPIQCY